MFPLVILMIFSCALNPGNGTSGIALIYGVTDYNLIRDLSLTRNDAAAMGELFESKGYEVLLRIDNDNGIPASLDQLKQDMAYVKETIQENENFVFYFSGHGGRHLDLYLQYSDPPGTEGSGSDPDDEWLFLYESLVSTQFEDWSETAVSDEMLADLIADIPTPRKVVIIDACNAAGFIGSSPDVDRIPADYEWNEKTVKSGIFSDAFSLYFSFPETEEVDIPSNNAYVLSASGEREFSWENSGIQHGIFTYYFLQSPELGDKNRDGAVTIDEIYNYTSERIISEWNSEMLNSDYHYHPHITGGPVMFSLFPSD